MKNNNIEKIEIIFNQNESFEKIISKQKWNKKSPQCPYCLSNKFSNIKNENRYHCNVCNTSYSLKTQGLFHNTKIPLIKWFILIFYIYEKENLSIRKIANLINVSNNTAVRMKKQIGFYKYESEMYYNLMVQELLKVK